MNSTSARQQPYSSQQPASSASAGGMDRPLGPPPVWRRLVLYGVAGLFLAGIATWALSVSTATTYRIPADRLTLGTVRRAPFEDYIAVRATAAPFTTHYLTAEQGGSVEKVLVEDGARVKAGQPLIVLANSALQLQVASREADVANQINALENTRLQLEDARFKYEHDLLDIEHQIGTLQSNLARDRILLDGNAIAPSTYQQEKDEYAYDLKLRDATIASRNAQQAVRARELAQLRETLARLNASIVTARASLDGLTIRAATDGQLTALSAEVGESKAQGAILGQVDSLDRFKIIAQVDEFYLGRVVVGQVALFTFDGHDYEARVAKIFPQVTNGTFRADFHFPSPAPQGIHTGQALDLRLQLGETTRVLIVNNGPFYQETGGQWAFVVSADGTHAARRSVRLGRRNPESVEIVAGLEPGERIIVSSYEAFRKADRVAIEAAHSN